MNVNKLLIETSNNINKLLDLKNRTKQSIINDNLSNIEALSANGVSYRQLLISGNIPIALKHFHDLIYRAKKKRTLFNNNKKHELEAPSQSVSSSTTIKGKDKFNQDQRTTSSTNQNATVTHSHSKQIDPLNYDLVEWKMMLSDISENLVKDIVKHGYTLSDAQQWIRENQIPNSSVLRRHFNSIRFKKQ
ncbi:hypothetical protein [Vibrio mediterranei]|uniref:Uncharacterized protein n=1 Tax=Vibrio mediterranei TaxID=689 RepID=A0ABX5D6U5_9VIBR|nr:hypothetical protein [Vibrio mediterranei]PCD85914.1 hypothetical protein COR52_24345 [Vibrio mediterranei]PRQ65367.1 hypothetical protein COR51_22340 [Vibrio mediterranei]